VAAAGLVLVLMQEVKHEVNASGRGSGKEAGKGKGDGAGGVVDSRSGLSQAPTDSDDVGLGKSRVAAAAAEDAGAREEEAAFACPLGLELVAAVATICVVSFLYNAGQSTFDSFFPMYTSQVLGLGPRRGSCAGYQKSADDTARKTYFGVMTTLSNAACSREFTFHSHWTPVPCHGNRHFAFERHVDWYRVEKDAATNRASDQPHDPPNL
jgi:hypothetical protein